MPPLEFHYQSNLSLFLFFSGGGLKWNCDGETQSCPSSFTSSSSCFVLCCHLGTIVSPPTCFCFCVLHSGRRSDVDFGSVKKKKVEVFQGWQNSQWNPVWPQQRCEVRTRLRSPTPAIPFFHSTCICCVFLSQCNITRGDVPEHFWWQALPLIVAGSAGSYFIIYLFMHFYLFVFLCGCQAAKAAGGKNEQQSSGRR